MRRTHTSPLPRRPRSCSAGILGGWLSALALLVGFGALAPAADATSIRSTAGVTAATTGLPDASSVVPLDACAAPSAIHAACLAKVLGVRGTRSLVHPHLRRPASPFRLSRRASRLTRTGSPLVVSAAGAPQPGTPAYLQQAYDLAYLSQTAGAGATIAIVDAFDAPQAEADLAAYRTEFLLPPCTTDNGCFRKVDQNGGVSYPSSTSAGWELETALDLDAVSAMCPNCHIVLVEAASDTLPDLATAQAEAAQLGASVISDSWAVAYGGHGAAAAFADSGTYTFPGVTTIAASGDSGYLGTYANSFPAALGDVTAAGGTTLVPATAGGSDGARGFEESAWSGAGSGCVWQVSKPVWQTDTGCNGRAYTDLSADADPNTGMQVYDSSHNGWLVVGGTSEAAPLIAAYYALLGSVPQSPAWAYANAAQLNDPSAGTNGACWTSLAYICNAGAGYDGPTGAGSISGAVTTGAPGIGGPGASSSYAQNVSAGETQFQGGVYPNGADTTYWWEYGTSTGYDQQTPATDIGSGSTPVAVSDSLSGLAPGTTYHYRLVAQNSFGTEYGYDYTLTTTGTPTGSATPGSGPATGPSSGPATGPSSGPATGPGTPVPAAPPVTSPAPPAGTSGSASGPAAGTASSSQTPPALGKPRVASAGASSATLTAAVLTSATTTYSIQYGDTPALGHSVTGSIGTSSRSLSGTLRGLAPGHTYYARVVVRDTAGSATSATIRFRTSPVTITRLAIRGGKLVAVLRCHGSAACHVQVKARSGSRLASAGRVTLGGNRSATVTLNRRTGRPTTLSVLSSWNGYPAVVSATISLG